MKLRRIKAFSNAGNFLKNKGCLAVHMLCLYFVVVFFHFTLFCFVFWQIKNNLYTQPFSIHEQKGNKKNCYR